MFIDAAFYHDLTKINRSDHIPQGHDYFVLSSGYSQLITLPQVNTEHLSRHDYQLIYVVGGPLHYYDKDGTEHIAPAESFLLFSQNLPPCTFTPLRDESKNRSLSSI